jgi:hypothetical protein
MATNTEGADMDTQTHCHCGAYNGSDHCPECYCEQYEGGCDHQVEPPLDTPPASELARRLKLMVDVYGVALDSGDREWSDQVARQVRLLQDQLASSLYDREQGWA